MKYQDGLKFLRTNLPKADQSYSDLHFDRQHKSLHIDQDDYKIYLAWYSAAACKTRLVAIATFPILYFPLLSGTLEAWSYAGSTAHLRSTY